MKLWQAVAVVGLCGAGPVWASDVDRLIDALGVPDIIDIMREEGLAYGQTLAQDMLPGQAPASWNQTISVIYDAGTMERAVRARFAESFGDADVAPLLEFFASEAGSELIALEVTARRAMVDEAVEEAAREAFRKVDGTDDARLGLIEAFVAENDLVEANVAGALNASLNFYNGLASGETFEMTEDQILRDVWAQEPETRDDTREWVYAFLLMAYGPAPDSTIEVYTELSATPSGKALNTALFAAFNDMYDKISYDLGRAVAQAMVVQDL